MWFRKTLNSQNSLWYSTASNHSGKIRLGSNAHNQGFQKQQGKVEVFDSTGATLLETIILPRESDYGDVSHASGTKRLRVTLVTGSRGIMNNYYNGGHFRLTQAEFEAVIRNYLQAGYQRGFWSYPAYEATYNINSILKVIPRRGMPTGGTLVTNGGSTYFNGELVPELKQFEFNTNSLNHHGMFFLSSTTGDINNLLGSMNSRVLIHANNTTGIIDQTYLNRPNDWCMRLTGRSGMWPNNVADLSLMTKLEYAQLGNGITSVIWGNLGLLKGVDLNGNDFSGTLDLSGMTNVNAGNNVGGGYLDGIAVTHCKLLSSLIVPVGNSANASWQYVLSVTGSALTSIQFPVGCRIKNLIGNDMTSATTWAVDLTNMSTGFSLQMQNAKLHGITPPSKAGLVYNCWLTNNIFTTEVNWAQLMNAGGTNALFRIGSNYSPYAATYPWAIPLGVMKGHYLWDLDYLKNFTLQMLYDSVKSLYDARALLTSSSFRQLLIRHGGMATKSTVAPADYVTGTSDGTITVPVDDAGYQLAVRQMCHVLFNQLKDGLTVKSSNEDLKYRFTTLAL
ncbi:hypothetical protein ACFS7Z_13765 [Pontibacter toksunensis]|uniref:Uncharacterized protein n=1 Tax=Pontibacter toksunensis TaxID=1332631 RepID=A0ABW6BWX6_9BACT